MNSRTIFDANAHATRKLEWLLFAVALVCSIYVLPRWADWNVNSRMNVAFAFVDRGTLAIDAYYQNTGDYAFFEGHYYSDKAPGTSFAAIPLYALFKTLGARQITDGIAARIATHPVFRATLDPNGKGLIAESVYAYSALIFVTFFAVALPCAFLAVLLFRLARFWTNDSNVAFLVALGYSIATPALAYSNNLYGHQIGACLLIAAFYVLFQSGRGERVYLYTPLAGFLLGAVVIVEYQTALIAGALGLYGAHKLRNWKLIFAMGAAALPPLALAAFYNWSIFHTPLPVGYLYSPLYLDLHRIGLISLTYPKLDALAELMFGARRGLFLMSPLLLLSVPGFVFFAQAKKWRAEFFVCAWAVASFYLFNSSSAMWQGGFAVGPRYLLPMLPFMALPIAFVLQRARAMGARVAIAILYVASILGVWILVLGGQEFPQYQNNPWFEYSIPHLLRGDVARNFGMLVNLHGLASMLPLVVVLGAMALLYLWQQRQLETRQDAPPMAEARVLPR